MNSGGHKKDVLHCPCDAVTGQVQAREERGGFTTAGLFIFCRNNIKKTRMQCHTSATCPILPRSATASVKAPSDHQGCDSRHSKIFPYVIAFSLLSSFNYDPTYAVL